MSVSIELDKKITELKTGDEIYRIRYGNTLYYKKIKILDVVPWKYNKNKYKFIVKGGVGKPQYITENLNIVAYKSRYFKDYSSMMLYIINRCKVAKKSKSMQKDIDYFKIKYAEYLI